MMRPPNMMRFHWGMMADAAASSQPNTAPPTPRRMKSRAIGSIVMKMAPKIDPRMLPSPPMMHIARNWMEMSRVKLSKFAIE